LGTAFGAHSITGDGSGEPRGVLLDASAGVTGQPNVAGAFSAEDLVDLSSSVVSGYARSPSAAWVMSNSTWGQVRKLRDDSGASAGTGGFMFNADVVPGSGAVGTLLGRPVFLDGAMPDFAPAAESIAFGDWSKVFVRFAGGMRFESSTDYAFANDLTTLRCLSRIDSALIDTSAIKTFIGSADT
jgi:HK97 family phage major capsid protein